MKGTSERWYELDDARALGDPLTDEELAFLDEHAPAREAEELFDEIESYGAYEPARADDCRRAEATLSRFNAAQTRRKSMAAVRTASVALLAVAAALLLWTFASSREIGWESTGEARVSTGSFVLAGDELATGTAVPAGEWIEASERACIDVAEGRACVEAASELRIVDGAVELRTGALSVEQGEVEVTDETGTRTLGVGESTSVEPPRVVAAARGSATSAATPLAVVPAAVPAEVDEAAAIEIDAAEVGERETTERASSRHVSRAVPDKTASQMLAEARALANAGELGRAVTAYEALRRAHPQSTDAHAANVSIGLLLLRRGQARKALRSFDRYLARPGGLAEEARWGRVKALHALRRGADRDAAIDRLLAAHPRTIYAAEAKAMRGG